MLSRRKNLGWGVGWVEVSKYPKLKLGVVHVRLLDQIVSTTEINPNLVHLLNGLGMSTKTLNYQSYVQVRSGLATHSWKMETSNCSPQMMAQNWCNYH